MLSGFFDSRPFFADIAKNLPQKSSFSGLANSSAKLALLAYLADHSQNLENTKNLVCILKEESEMLEWQGLLPMFFDQKKYNFFFLPKGDTREEIKVEWQIQVAQSGHSEKRNIFLIPEADAITESFSQIQHLMNLQIILQKGEKITPIQLFNNLIEIGFEVAPDITLQKGQYRRSGDIIDIFPVGSANPFKIEIEFDQIKNIWSFSMQDKKILKSYNKLSIFPAKISGGDTNFYHLLSPTDLIITDDVDDLPGEYLQKTESKVLEFTPFPEGDDGKHFQMRFLSVLKFYVLYDLLADLRVKLEKKYLIFLYTKRVEEIKNIFLENNIPFYEGVQIPPSPPLSKGEQDDSKISSSLREQQNGIFPQSAQEGPLDKGCLGDSETGLYLIDANDAEVMPPSFQNPDQNILMLTDREIFQLRRSKKQKSLDKLNMEYLTSLKIGDYVVHMDHGVGHFLGVSEQEIDGHTREYLEIAYAGSDRLFVPVDQADKVSRFLCEEGEEPKLTRLGSVEWENMQKKAKKETEKIAKELLKLYAEREQAMKEKYLADKSLMRAFEENFPYELTPGQISALNDVKSDMEQGKPMDRLVCGDVGFGKTEVAMRAAVKAVENGKQVAIISPVTILTQQHYDSFRKRVEEIPEIRVEMISRFRTPAEQKRILENLKKGKIDVIIGTHRLLQADVDFDNLGLLIIDEEQRFGVKQKEAFKELRKNVDILTLTATPIPRTLNLALNKLRDISTITTPPLGRLPVITEVRKFSDRLVRDAIMRELERGGQIYFLHNRVQTIEGMADKLRHLVPEAKVVVGHGQLNPQELEKRIFAFKKGEYDILISSTIIENGIDLPNANTMIVMNAERFGLSQLYQLRGRIGRGKRQAFAYFLYQTQKLSIEAKKRLKAIVEASELGSGFQIAMRDLEIRGSGEILGVSQSGSVNNVGVGHFLRLLNETVRKMKQGKKEEDIEETKDITIELPVDAYIPTAYIADSKEKIMAYQNLAAIKDFEDLKEITDDFYEEYGNIPREVRTLLRIIELKIMAREANVLSIRSAPVSGGKREVQMTLGKKVGAKEIMNLLAKQEKWMVSTDKLKIPLPDLGMDFLEEIKKSLEALRPEKKQEKKSLSHSPLLKGNS